MTQECGAKFSGHWRIILDMLHDQLKASGFLNLISSFSKTQPVLELVWSLIKRSPDLSSSVGLGKTRMQVMPPSQNTGLPG